MSVIIAIVCISIYSDKPCRICKFSICPENIDLTADRMWTCICSSGCVVRDPGADLYGIEESGTLNCIFAGNSDRLLQYVKRLSEHGS